VLFRRKLRREKLLDFLASQPRSVVAMEACASAHYWGREIGRLGHEVRLVAPTYVKPFVKRQKNDTADAEAICEAGGRPTMRFVAVESEAQQASAMIFKGRDLLVRKATINASRGHLAEFGISCAHFDRRSGLALAAACACQVEGAMFRTLHIGSTPNSSRCSPMKPIISATGGRAPPARKCAGLLQDLVGLPQLANLALEFLHRALMSPVTPARTPTSISASRTQRRNVSAVQPILLDTDTRAAQREP
jgi:hypothetical protein